VPGCRPGEEVALGADDAHHMARVVRRRAGDAVELIDGEGIIWPATVVSPDPAVVRVGPAPRTPPARLGVSLAVGLAEWGRLHLVVEKATELGVPSITVVSSDRSGRVPDAAGFERRRARMLRVAEAAARQSGHAALPEIRGIVPLDEVLTHTDPVFVVDPRGETGLADAVAATAPETALVVVGADAGFSEDEIDRARDAGATIARMGDAVLRTETAAIVAISITAAVMGALGGPRR